MKPVWLNRYGKERPSLIEGLEIITDLLELKQVIGRERPEQGAIR